MTVVHSFQNYISRESLSGVVLFLSTMLAVWVANSSLGQAYYDLWRVALGINIGELSISMTLTDWINDGLMALFFLMVGLEIKREIVVGDLSSVKKASFPIFAAIGGMVVPALIYIALNPNNPLGFGIPMATDIAFSLGVLMLLGKRVSSSVKLFLVTLAVVDDLGAVIVVASVYTDELQYAYLMHVTIVYLLIWMLNLNGVKSLIPYLILGVFLWIYIHNIGVHATIAGVLLAFAIPIKSKIKEKEFVKKTKKFLAKFETNIDKKPIINDDQIDALEHISYGYDKVQNPLLRLEHNLHGFSAFVIMPLFAFSNAGVVLDFSYVSANIMIVLGVFFGLLIGKPLGIFGFTYYAAKLKLIKLPKHISWNEVLAIGFIGGIGFTMSVFITHLAFLDESIIAAVKIGVFLASFIATIIGVYLLLKSNKLNDKSV